jgi:hypothetical protein
MQLVYLQGAFVHVNQDEKNETEKFYGYIIDLWRILEQKLNFTWVSCYNSTMQSQHISVCDG